MTLPAWYLDGRGRGERNRRVDLAYATTGHRAQGLTRWRALVRLTGREDSNWLFVQLSWARHQTTLYPVVGPEPQGSAELDLPDRETGDGYDQLAQAVSRAGDQRLAIDTLSSLDLRRLSVAELRAERDRLQRLLDQAPRDRARELVRAGTRRAEADQALEKLTTKDDAQRQGHGMLRLRRSAELALRQHQQRRAGWLEANAHLGPAYRQVMRELAWQRRAVGLAAEREQPGYLREELGPVPESTRGRRAWRQAAAAIEDYRRSYQITDPERALGPVPREPAQRAAWQQARTAAQRVQERQRTAHRAERMTPAHPSPIDRSQRDHARAPEQRAAARQRGPERAAGWQPGGGQLCPGPTQPSPIPIRTAAGCPATRSSRACPSGHSATPTSRPCSPTSTTTTGTSAC
jgi:hypothetical protein